MASDEDEEAFTPGAARLAAAPDRAPSNDTLFHTTVPLLAHDANSMVECALF